MGKTQGHQKYKLKDGTIVPGVTTITGVLNKPALVRWSNNLGLKGIDVSKYVDDLADTGTLAHYIIECYFKKEEPDYKDYTPNQVDKASNSVLKYFAWEKENKMEVISSELQMISESLKYGGTCDVYCLLNGKKTLIDLKTSKAVYDEMFTQVSAYKNLLEENGYPVEDVRILRIGRDETEGFEDIKVPKVDLHFKRFKACLEIYYLNKVLKGE